MDNVAFDVVIGLVFIYLLYSLYATVFIEIISSVFNLRGLNLYYSLARMLKDEKVFTNPVKRYLVELSTTITRVRGTALNLKNPDLYNRVISQPVIRYQTSGGLGNKAAYLTAETFSKALIDSIKTDNPDASLLACIEDGLEKLPDNSDTKNYIRSLLDDSNSDLTKFRILLERWYNETQDRAAGWYKQTTQVLLLFIGAFLVFAFNVDTLAIIKKLSIDQEARNNLVQMAISYQERNDGEAPSGDEKVPRNNLDSLKSALEKDIANAQSILSSNWNIGNEIFFLEEKTDSQLKPGFKYVPFKSTNPKADIKTEIYLVVHESVDEKTLRKILPDKISKEENEGKDPHFKISTTRYKLGYIFSGGRIWGYLLTVIAIAIGSPFWFDLLNKLIRLRSSKPVQPEPETGSVSNTAISNRGILNRVG